MDARFEKENIKYQDSSIPSKRGPARYCGLILYTGCGESRDDSISTPFIFI